MLDVESVKKKLRAVLLSSKDGVPLSRLRSDYLSMCGESIPLKQMGFTTLEDFLWSVPSVVRMEYRQGKLQCFAGLSKETVHLAELVAKQKNPKKHGRSQLVSCKMRFKSSSSQMFNVKPGAVLRQPKGAGSAGKMVNHPLTCKGYGGCTASDFYRTISNVYDVEQVQRRLTQLLAKHCSGLWLSKLPVVYKEMFGQKLNHQALIDLEQWKHICSVEKIGGGKRADRLMYPALPPKPFSASTTARASTTTMQSTNVPCAVPMPKQTWTCLTPPPTPTPTVTNKSFLTKPFLFPPQPVSGSQVLPCSLPNPVPPPTSLPSSSAKGDLCCNISPSGPSSSTSKLACPSTLEPAPVPSSNTNESDLSADIRQKLKELLSKYSYGVWVHALPKLFMETYKIPFPEHALNNLSLLEDICSVEYPIPANKKKAILCSSSITDTCTTKSKASNSCSSSILPSGLGALAPVLPPPLIVPTEQFSSVLVTDAKNTKAVTVRYVGDNYSAAQEAMEDSMRSFYSQNSANKPLSKLAFGQLTAVRCDEDELTRAQIMEVMTSNMVKVYYLDHGFSVETSRTNLFELHPDFLSLPFQAINVRLAGLESFSSHPLILSSLESLALGKILLMETVEPCNQKEASLVLLYDTSQDDDINVNATCLKALQDRTMDIPLTVNATFQNVCVTSVCPDGIIYCQLCSRGIIKLKTLLDRIDAAFLSQVTSESLVSRPFSGKVCLARCKGKWSRVEITNLHGNRVMDIFFVDLGLSASVEVTELREIPLPFLNDLTAIPPQAIKCRLADLADPAGGWSPEALLWLRKTVVNSVDCSIKISELKPSEKDKLPFIFLFTSADSQEVDKSVNHQLAQSHWFKKPIVDNSIITVTKANNNNMDTGDVLEKAFSRLALSPALSSPAQYQHSKGDCQIKTNRDDERPLLMPPPLDLPQPGQNLDVFVSVACHPGHFMIQPCRDQFKLVVLMGEMVLYYNQTEAAATRFQDGEVYAAKVDKNWYRVQVKGILTNGMVSVLQLDYGKYVLVSCTHLKPLIKEFRQLSFQAVKAQLAGVTHCQWSEEASILFRNHVENRALVAQVECVQEARAPMSPQVKGELQERSLTVYLVDTSDKVKDVWIHDVMADINKKLSLSDSQLHKQGR
ncbi:tudor domain-containing protein 7A [Lampris incognitus]|uniref:tudor domain-containing protein 7A n=1 Tax=Lampris incognitus TaxID=2546036 RepID=UPI0024B5B8D8|nr:tudor domain-containing protein 7A [Lampris incognitus]